MSVTVILAALIAALLAGSPPPPPPPSLPLATVRVDVGEQRLVIELPPVDLPAATPGHDTMVGLPLCHVLVPVSASLHSARVEVVDETGRVLPPDVLHHFNLSDPEHRELFLPIGLHLLAASKETPQIEVPRLLFGLPLERADVSGGRVLWHGEPISDGPRVLAFPLTRFYNWHRLGLHIVPTHRYRLTAVYENPTGRLIPDGGMGAVAGLFIPDRGAVWPAVDTSDVLYRTDQAATRVSGGADAMMMMEHTAH